MDVIDHQNCGGDWMADFFHVFSNSLAMGQDPHTRDCDVQYIWFTICVDLVLISGSHEFPWKFYCSCILDPTWSHAKAHDISAKWAAWHPIAIIHPELLVNKVHGAQAKQSQVPGFSDQFSEAVDIWTFRLYKLSKFNWYLSRRLLELLFWVGKGSQQRTTMICEQEDIYIYIHTWPRKHVANPAELSHDHLYSLYHGWTIMRIKIQEPWMEHLAVCQNLVPLVNIKIAGKWMFIP